MIVFTKNVRLNAAFSGMRRRETFCRTLKCTWRSGQVFGTSPNLLGDIQKLASCSLKLEGI